MKALKISLAVMLVILCLLACRSQQPAPTTSPMTTAEPTTAPETSVPETTAEPALYTPDAGSILNKIPYYGEADYAEIRSMSHDGTYAKQTNLSVTVTTKDMLGGGEMLMFSGVKNEKGMIAYREELARWGFELYAESQMGDCQYSTWTSDDTVVTLMYIPYYHRLGIIAEPMRALPARKQDNQYTNLGVENKVIMISCQFMDQDNGLCAVFQLCDGSFIIVDSGQGWHQRNSKKYKDHWQNNAKEIFHVLEAYSPDRDGDGDKDKDDIVIASWFFTHQHMDHIGGYPIFADHFADKVTLEQVVFNLPNEEITEEFTDGFIAKGDGKEITGEYVELLESVTTDYFPDAKMVEAHPGQVYYIRDAVIEMLYTWELDWNMPNRCNSLSLVFTVEIGDTKVMVPGDSGQSATRLIQNVYNDYLKSDIIMTIHHGSSGGTSAFNRYVDPDVVLWPASQSHYDSIKNKEYNRPLLEADAIYVVGDKVLAVTLPYKGPESVIVRDVIEPVLRSE